MDAPSSPPVAASSVRPRPRPPWRRNTLAAVTGLAVAALVAIGGTLFWQQRPAESRATNTQVVLPDAENAGVAGYYDTLSSGQIATTFAQILALRGTAPTNEVDANVTIEVEVIPSTLLIQVSATAADAQTAEAAADAALARARPYLDQLSSPYDVFEVRSAKGTAEPSGLTPELLAGVVTAVAIIAGVAAALAVSALQQTLQSSRRQPKASSAALASERGSESRPTATRPTAVQPTAQPAALRGTPAVKDDGGKGSATSGGRSLAAANPRPPQPAR